MTEPVEGKSAAADEIVRMQQQISHLQESLRIQQRVAYAAGLFQGEVTVRTLVSSLAEGLLIIDSDQRIILINHRLEEMFGYASGEMIGQFLQTLLPDRYAQVHGHHVNAYFQAPRIRSIGQGLELVGRRKDGAEFPVEVSLSYLDTETGRFSLAFITDVTQRRQAERALLEQNEALNTFAQTVAHDLVSSVTVLVGLSEYLTETYIDVPPPELQEYLATIARSGRKMSSIINELLLLASLRQDEVVLGPVEMVPIIETALFRLHEVIQTEHAEIIQSDGFPPVLGYAPWLEEVWFNYLSNALKYGGRPPRVEIGSTVADNGYVKFWVKDNGVGVSPDRQAQLFKAGQRLEQYRAKGHGLGLSIVQQIVRKLSGQVSLESTQGQGSVFGFSLLQVKTE
ncbi:two-component system, OmpR family, phosphate regulon sensor histidine kinase PhoR [Thermoflexales bacterium]|nr:two-component system, OmpR family, phosphate regulon sensor histidine kinase PhoR [Thermoflexales bacterium]